MVDEGFLTPDQLSLALAEQSRTERPLGAILVELGFVSAGAVANALAEQHGGLLKTEFGVSAGLYALPGGVTRKAAAEAALDPAAARTIELETQLQAVLTERNTLAQRVNEQAVRLSEAAQAKEAEVARVTDAAAAHIAGLEAKLESAAGRDELISELQREVAELREQAEQRPDERDAQAHAAEVARVTDAAAAHIAALEAQLESALAGRDELISELRREVAELRERAEQRPDEGVPQAQAEEVARVTDAATAHIAGLEAEHESALAGRDELISELQREVAELREQAEQPQDEETESEPEAAGGHAHLLFVPSAGGYALIEFSGEDPPSGTLLDIAGVGYVVRRVGPSPFPGTRLRCVFLERV